jgi:hypothetical protein
MMKFPIDNKIKVLIGDQDSACLCYNTILKEPRSNDNKTLKEPRSQETLSVATNFRDERTLKRGEPVEELVEVVTEGPNWKVKIGSQFTAEIREELSDFLNSNNDMFAWMHQDMPRINPEVMTHVLIVDLTVKPVKRKKRSFAHERNKAMLKK